MSKEKTPNYTEELTEQMITIYTAATDEAERAKAVDEIQKLTGRTTASIRSKLAFEKVWVAKAKPESKGGKRITKSDLVAEIADNADKKQDTFFDSLAGANTAVLEYITGLQGEVVALRAELDGEESPEDEAS